MLVLLAIAELFGMSLWFSASAVSGQLARTWNLSGGETGWLTTIVQLGFVIGTAFSAVLNLPDIISSRRFFAVAAALAAIANASLLGAHSFPVALLLRFATGFFLAGVYPPAMKMVSTWFHGRRGLAIGTIVGALTVGKATPYLTHALSPASVPVVVVGSSVAAVTASLLVAFFYRDGPFVFPARPFSWSLARVVWREPSFRLVTAGYLGHMFELYSFWTWIPAYLAASALLSDGFSGTRVALLAFLAIAVGGAGCVWGGLNADRFGRERLVIRALAASGLCSILIGVVYGKSLWLVVAVACVWGFFVIADSAQFSTLITESVPSYAVGTALAMQTSLGFLLTMVSIQLLPPIVSATGWQWSFTVLALGPVCGIAAIRRLALMRASRHKTL